MTKEGLRGRTSIGKTRGNDTGHSKRKYFVKKGFSYPKKAGRLVGSRECEYRPNTSN